MSPAVWSYCDQIERNINSTEKLWEIDVVLRIIELLIVFPDLWAGGHHRVALQRLPQGCLSSSSRRGLPCRGQRVHLTLWASLERLPQGCLHSSPIAGDCPVDSLRSESTFNPTVLSFPSTAVPPKDTCLHLLAGDCPVEVREYI